MVPRYIAEIPEEDGWGNDLEVYIETDIDKALQLQSVMLIRSAGSDGRFDSNRYVPGAIPELEYSHDIVWVDGFFVRAPAKLLPHRAIPAPMPEPVPIVCPGGVRAGLAEPLLGQGEQAPRSELGAVMGRAAAEEESAPEKLGQHGAASGFGRLRTKGVFLRV